MIWNIIDRRKNRYRWKCINGIVEATSHDNAKSDGDHADGGDDIVYDQRLGISLADAITWANSLPGGVTLYLYDEGSGARPRLTPDPQLWTGALGKAPLVEPDGTERTHISTKSAFGSGIPQRTRQTSLWPWGSAHHGVGELESRDLLRKAPRWKADGLIAIGPPGWLKVSGRKSGW
jgi:hypothetical protein